MSIVYWKADESTFELLNSIVKDGDDVKKADVRINILFVLGGANSVSSPVKENGHPVDGTIKIVPLRDRITKSFDVEFLISADAWRNSSTTHKLAILSHLLQKIEIKKPKPKKKKNNRGRVGGDNGSDQEREALNEPQFLTDDIGRPLLKVRRYDWGTSGGFRSVVEQYGQAAPEHRSVNGILAIINSAMAVYKESVAKS